MASPSTGSLDRWGVSFGVVAEFDEARGLGTLTAPDTNGVPFHVIEIVDGTRTIDIGQQVAWVPRLRFGGLEASCLVKVPA